MRPAAVIKLLSVALGVLCAVAIATPVYAQSCLDQCIDQYDQDKQACDQALADRLAELDLEAQACLDNNPDPLAAGLCLRNVNVKRYAARNDWRRCIALANTAAYDCYRNCQSPVQP